MSPGGHLQQSQVFGHVQLRAVDGVGVVQPGERVVEVHLELGPLLAVLAQLTVLVLRLCLQGRPPLQYT